MLQLLAAAYVAPSSLILSTVMMVVIHSYEMSVLARATQCHIPEDSILHRHCCENLKSYVRTLLSCRDQYRRNETCLHTVFEIITKTRS
jgi:hypothetical protein